MVCEYGQSDGAWMAQARIGLTETDKNTVEPSGV